MAPAISRTENRQILDWARALAALAVCVSHIRNLLLQDYTPGLGAAGKAFYFVTNYGHSAVIVFFVLSGFFVGGSVLRASGESRFSWGSYLADRGTRLWIVLLPALVVTLLWDKTGLLLGHGGFYAGTEGNADQTANVASQLGLATFICNGAFLQTIVCPTYGSNGPLWSLANEFWYYLWFPALLGLALPLNRAARPGSAARFVPSWAIVRFAPALLAIASMALIGGFLEGFLVWLLGALAAWLESRRPRHLPAAAALPWLALALFAGLLVAARLGHARDIVLGAGFFIFLMALLWRTPPESRVAHRSPSVARLLALGPFFSRFSYSLYLTHFPVTLLICAALLGHRVPWSTSGLAWFAAVLLVCYFYAYGFYWLFERNTGVLRGWLSRRAGTRAARAPTEPRYEGAQPHPSESVARPGAGSADEGIGALNK